jgi:peptidoglycan/xylan/chitin deacetylase (PgdA/CDA1 family)
MYTVTQQVFEKQMEHLSKVGYRTLKIRELLDWLEGKLKIKERAVVVTFDDGWLDNYLFAYPILVKYGINASVFVVTDWIKRASAEKLPVPEAVPTHSESKQLIAKNQDYRVILNWDLIAKMAQNGLIDFYSHSRSHLKCDKLSRADLINELAESKAAIDLMLKRPCPYLCWPFGNFNDATVKVAKQTGYKALFTTIHGVARQGADPFAIYRIEVQDSIEWFKTRLMIYTDPLLSRLYVIIKKIMTH